MSPGDNKNHMKRESMFRVLLLACVTATGISTSAQLVSRPEDRGEDMSTLATSDAVSRFSRSSDAIERRKLARVIGDRSIAGSLQLSGPENGQLQQQVAGILQGAKSPDANTRSEAQQQIERLWLAAVPTLVSNITPKDVTVSEMAVKSLILMRNESIVSNLIWEAKATTDEGRRQMLIFALSRMKEKRTSLIPGRACLDDRQSEELYSRLVVPALDALKPAAAETRK
jgi:hypothetical protein